MQILHIGDVNKYTQGSESENKPVCAKNAYTVIGWEMEMNQDPFKEYIRESEPE